MTKLKNIFSLILKIAIVILLVFLITKVVKKKDYIYQEVPVYDTVYVDKPYVMEKGFKHKAFPSLVLIFSDSIEIEKPVIDIVHDTIIVNNSFDVSPLFLSKFPDSPKLIDMTLSESKLSLSMLNRKGLTYTEIYDLNLIRNMYKYQDKGLTYKRKPLYSNISTYVSTTIRPFNKLYDLDLGVKYKTTRFNYETGLNVFYYPKLKTVPGMDMYLKLTYNF